METFWAILKDNRFKVKLLSKLLQLLEEIGLHFIPTFGHTDWDPELLFGKSCSCYTIQYPALFLQKLTFRRLPTFVYLLMSTYISTYQCLTTYLCLPTYIPMYLHIISAYSGAGIGLDSLEAPFLASTRLTSMKTTTTTTPMTRCRRPTTKMKATSCSR